IQINAIVIVETKLNIFLIPKGYAFHKILDLVDLDFGMDFAEREINPANISVKGVSFIQRNKKRGLTDYKENTTEFAQASESYFNISGTPDFEVGYGKNSKCKAHTTYIIFKKFFHSNTSVIGSFCTLISLK